jgi:hypothetical protein
VRPEYPEGTITIIIKKASRIQYKTITIRARSGEGVAGRVKERQIGGVKGKERNNLRGQTGKAKMQ